MKNSVLISIFTIASLCAAQFEPNQCGPKAGNQKCRQNKCCSQYGWCGTSNAYCQATQGCQAGFGRCTGVPPSSKSSLPSSVANPSASAAPISRNGRCGIAFGGQTCKGSTFGDCCSTYNWCGKTAGHCKASLGCQPGFGTCNGIQSSAVSSTLSQGVSSATSKDSSSTLSSSLTLSHSSSSSAIAASSTTLSTRASISSSGSSSIASSQSSATSSSALTVASGSASQSSSSMSLSFSSSAIGSPSSSIATISSSPSDHSISSSAVSSFSSSLMLSGTAMLASPSASLISSTNVVSASPSASGSATVITHVLRAARNPSIDRAAPENLVPKNALSFFFAEDGTSYTTSVRTNLDSGALGVLLENIASLSSVTCSGSSINLQFSDEASANTARNWPAGTILFTLSNGCNTATERGVYRLRATVTTTTPVAKLRARVTSVAQTVNAWSFTLEALLIQMVAVVADYDELKRMAAEEAAAAASTSPPIPSATVSSVAVSSATGAQPSAAATGLPACGGYAPGGRFDIGGTSYQISCTLAGTWRDRWIDFSYQESFAACLAHCNALAQCVVASWNVQQVSNGKFMCLRWPLLPFKTENAVDAPMAVKIV